MDHMPKLWASGISHKSKINDLNKSFLKIRWCNFNFHEKITINNDDVRWYMINADKFILIKNNVESIKISLFLFMLY